MTDRPFPILGTSGPSSVTGIPWGVIAPHERQARLNHAGQTLRRLAERGGLSPCEAVAVLENRPWRRMAPAAANAALVEILGRH